MHCICFSLYNCCYVMKTYLKGLIHTYIIFLSSVNAHLKGLPASSSSSSHWACLSLFLRGNMVACFALPVCVCMCACVRERELTAHLEREIGSNQCPIGDDDDGEEEEEEIEWAHDETWGEKVPVKEGEKSRLPFSLCESIALHWEGSFTKMGLQLIHGHVICTLKLMRN